MHIFKLLWLLYIYKCYYIANWMTYLGRNYSIFRQKAISVLVSISLQIIDHMHPEVLHNKRLAI